MSHKDKIAPEVVTELTKMMAEKCDGFQWAFVVLDKEAPLISCRATISGLFTMSGILHEEGLYYAKKN